MAPFFPNGGFKPLNNFGNSNAISLNRFPPTFGFNAGFNRPKALAEGAGDSQKESSSNILKNFPLKAAFTAGTLALTGDTIAQFVERYKKKKEDEKNISNLKPCCKKKAVAKSNAEFWRHDFIRALRMASYGFLLYGPGSYVWYKFLDKVLVEKTTKNFLLKVAANQLILGPSVLVVVFAWNFLWMKKVSELPQKYKKDLWPSLQDGWKFWIPAACLNFTIIPLDARVAFMSTCSIFWNFYLSSSIGKSNAVMKAVEELPQE